MQQGVREPIGAPPGRRRAETMHGLFQWCARQRPDAVAIVHGERQVSYAELDAASDDYAAELEAMGVGPGHRVAVLMPRTAEFVAVLLAVLKRGAAYAAFDVRWPAARAADLLDRLDARVLVTDEAGPWPVRVHAPATWDWAGAVSRHRRPAPVTVGPDDACAVFFTSGSTGLPKAVVSPHRGTVRLFDACEFADLGPGTAMPQLAPVPWDGFTLDCWSVLLSGGTSVFVDEPLLPGTLRDLVARHGVNGAFLTTALFNMLVDEDVHAFDGFAWLITGGERASVTHLRRFLEEHPGVPLHNVYGPVECTVLATAHRVTFQDCESPGGVPLGRALNGTRVHVLDDGRPCAAGEVGEIHLVGEGLVEGYLGDPELTARNFLAIEIDGAVRRCYRTGDLGHWSEAGVLHFDGRADRQVKIRGHRIEPAEVERAAGLIAGVTATAAVPVRGEDGRCEALVLFYSSSGDSPLDEVALRAQLARLLPEYMMPRRVQRVDPLPLLANGKTDWSALERLAGQAAVPADRGGDAPRTGSEKAIAAQIADILAVGSVSREESFFSLGASSLDVARLCARVDRHFGVAIPPSRVFALQTVAAIAAWVDDMLRDGGAAAVPAPATPAVPLPPHQALYLWEGVDERADIAYVCPMAWWIGGEVRTEALARAVQDVHQRHEALRARYAMQDGPTALLFDGADEAEFHRLPAQPDDAAAMDALRDALFRPLSLATGRIWRCALVQSAASGRRLFGLVVHHVAFDGACEPVLSEELGVAYAARVRGTEPVFAGPAATLSELTAEHQRRSAAADPEAQLAYWRGELAGMPELVIPQRLETPELVGPKSHAERTVPAADLQPWEADARRRGATRLTYAATVYGLVLSSLTGQRDFGVLVPFHRRNERLGPAISCRVDMMCLRLRLPDEPVGGVLDAVAHTTHRAMAALDVPFLDAARDVLASGRRHTILDLPVLLVDEDPQVPLALPGCTTDAVELDTPTTMTQLELRLSSTAEGGLRVMATVWTDRFPAEFAEHVVEEFTGVLRKGPAA